MVMAHPAKARRDTPAPGDNRDHPVAADPDNPAHADSLVHPVNRAEPDAPARADNRGGRASGGIPASADSSSLLLLLSFIPCRTARLPAPTTPFIHRSHDPVLVVYRISCCVRPHGGPASSGL